eukprot:TRINITY_DN99982_c0_g1_i1.p2 TRINITY_DN99982_c0_g1~~TRINITY_DN99982_c0_g1_i1.p2  ORF type:complete len:177 (+),score=29.57 TRINITY_DN99982_c0_g1_i1:23-532(+)
MTCAATKDSLPKLCECMRWICDSGIMTEDVFTTAGWTEACMKPGNLIEACDNAELKEVLQAWYSVPKKLRSDRTRECFVNLLPPPPPVLTLTCTEPGGHSEAHADMELRVMSMTGDTVAVFSGNASLLKIGWIREQIEKQTTLGTRFILISSSGQLLDSDDSLVTGLVG